MYASLGPSTEAAKALTTKPYFLAIRQVGTFIPGSNLDYHFCYSSYATLQTIKGTTDTPEFDEHVTLVDQARSYAKRFNSAVARGLQARGDIHCTGNENWGNIMSNIQKYLVQNKLVSVHKRGYFFKIKAHRLRKAQHILICEHLRRRRNAEIGKIDRLWMGTN